MANMYKDNQMNKRWICPATNKELQETLSTNLHVSPLFAQILINRGHTDVSSAKDFLKPEFSGLADPMELPDMEKAAKRINDAICKGEKIVIYGDYDVDGITGTALMFKCLDLVYAKVSYYIPERIEEGYGLNVKAIKKFSNEGINVIITVDCGINACVEAESAKQHGIDLIITDHHEPGEEIPDAFAVVNPKLESSNGQFNKLSGVGLAFKLAWAVAQTFSNGKRVSEEFRDFLISATGLAALGTITDVVPLYGENRIITKVGLKAIQQTKDPGLRALLKIANLEDEVLQTNHVGFRLGPRLNACGRIGKAGIAVELLTTKSEKRANEIISFIDDENKRRQKMQKGILELAKKKIDTEVDLKNNPAIILADEEWHPGIVGIVASRLSDEYFRPTIMFGCKNGVAHGSARSIPSFHILNALETCRNMLISLGGHSQAAGLKIYEDNIEEFKESFNNEASKVLNDEDLTPTLQIDAEVQLSTLSKSLIKEFERLAPYGEGNPAPCLSSTKLKIAGK
ncbi:MAG: single-stranded-DNA-specific exonuclease RecJ, partial [Candidatus Anammoxibacter sp.]